MPEYICHQYITKDIICESILYKLHIMCTEYICRQYMAIDVCESYFHILLLYISGFTVSINYSIKLETYTKLGDRVAKCDVQSGIVLGEGSFGVKINKFRNAIETGWL